MIQGRSALTDLCRSMLRLIDAEGSVEDRQIRAGLRLKNETFRKHMRLLEERGFIVRRNGMAISLSTNPGEQA